MDNNVSGFITNGLGDHDKEYLNRHDRSIYILPPVTLDLRHQAGMMPHAKELPPETTLEKGMILCKKEYPATYIHGNTVTFSSENDYLDYGKFNQHQIYVAIMYTQNNERRRILIQAEQKYDFLSMESFKFSTYIDVNELFSVEYSIVLGSPYIHPGDEVAHSKIFDYTCHTYKNYVIMNSIGISLDFTGMSVVNCNENVVFFRDSFYTMFSRNLEKYPAEISRNTKIINKKRQDLKFGIIQDIDNYRYIYYNPKDPQGSIYVASDYDEYDPEEPPNTISLMQYTLSDQFNSPGDMVYAERYLYDPLIDSMSVRTESLEGSSFDPISISKQEEISEECHVSITLRESVDIPELLEGEVPYRIILKNKKGVLCHE